MASTIKFAKGAGAPVKLDLRMMDNIASGVLFQLGHVQIGRFNKEVVRWGSGTNALKRSLFYFVGSGENQGAGRFSAGMAQQVREWVQQAILFPSARKRNVASGFFGPPRLDKEYIDWMREIGKGSQPTFYLFGTVAEAFNVIKGYAAAGVSLGISTSMRARRPIVGRVPIEFYPDSVPVWEYASNVHFGGKTPGRPIIAGAIVGWLEKAQPEWALALRKLMYDSYKLGLSEWSADGANILGEAESLDNEVSPGVHVVDVASPQGYVGAPETDIGNLETSAKHISQLAQEFAITDIQSFSPRFLRIVMDMTRELGQRLNMTPQGVDALQRAVLSGKTIDYSLVSSALYGGGKK